MSPPQHDSDLHYCICGKGFRTRQGLYKHVRRAKEWRIHHKA